VCPDVVVPLLPVLPLLLVLQSGRQPPADGDSVAASSRGHEGSAVLAVPDEGHHPDPLLEHHHGASNRPQSVRRLMMLPFLLTNRVAGGRGGGGDV